MYALGGMVWWKAVSNTATMGTPGMTFWQARIPVRLAGLCRGARGMQSSIAFSTASSISTDLLNASPPWTTRWPTAPISLMEEITPLSLSATASSTAWMASEWVGMGMSMASRVFFPSAL